MNLQRTALLLTATAVMLLAAGRHVINKILVPGDYGWDYLTADSDGRRLYISHDREVVVLDLDSGAIVGKIGEMKGVHGIAVSRNLGRGFISKTDPGSVTIFDLKTLAKINEVRVGDDPNAILFDQKTQRVFTADRGSKRITAFDAASGKIVNTSDGLGGKTEHAALDGKGHLFLNMQDSVTIVTDRDTGQSRGFGFVEMSNNAEGDRAIAAVNGHEVGGRALNVNEARPKDEYGGGIGRKPSRWFG